MLCIVTCIRAGTNISWCIFLIIEPTCCTGFFYRTKEPFYYNPTLCSCMDNKSFSQYDDPKQFLYCSLLGGVRWEAKPWLLAPELYKADTL